MDDNVHVDKNEKNGPPIADVDDDSVEIYTKQKGLMDYASLKNIQTRIGEDKKDLMIFVIKELLDNAVDYIESSVRNFTTEPSLSVYIDDNTIKISNTSILDKPPFTREKLDSIFTFDST